MKMRLTLSSLRSPHIKEKNPNTSYSKTHFEIMYQERVETKQDKIKLLVQIGIDP